MDIAILQERKICCAANYISKKNQMNTNENEGLIGIRPKEERLTWFVMCDRKRRNAIEPAYKMLRRMGFEVFTPLVRKIIGKGDAKKVVEMPFIIDLLFVHSTRQKLDPIEEEIATLHYRFKKGGKYREALVVREDDMNHFIHAVESTEVKEYFAVDALPVSLIGATVLIHGGPLDGYQVLLKKMRGSKKKHIFVELPKLVYAELELMEFDSLEIVKK